MDSIYLNLGLMEPTAMLGRVVNREPVPQPVSGLLAEPFHQRLPRMRTEVVQHQMNGVGLRIAGGDLPWVVGKRGRAAVCRYLGKVHPGFPFDPAKYVGGATELVLMIPSDRTSRLHGERFANLRVQGDGFLVQQTTGSSADQGCS